MAKLKSERHHWWPECVSEHWEDFDGCVNRLSPDSSVNRAPPYNFGVIGNGHLIKLGKDPAIDCPWDQSFEAEFQQADSNFPRVIEWLNHLDRCGPPFDRTIPSRIVVEKSDDQQFLDLLECVISLAARSPMHRERGVALAEDFRGPLPERDRNGLIGLNIRYALRNAMRDIGSRGKVMVIFSPEREFIFGDGFFNNLPSDGQHWHSPKLLVPLTPWIAVLFAKPMSYMTNPRIVTLVISPQETNQLNYAIQVYARNQIFFRSEQPSVELAFRSGKHQIFADHCNSIDELIHHIPGVPARDHALNELLASFTAVPSGSRRPAAHPRR